MGTTLRCTKMLLTALKTAPREQVPPPANRLGEWTANLVRVSRLQLVVAVSEPTRFAIVIDAAPYAGIAQRLSDRLVDALLLIGVPESLAVDEARSLRDAVIARTNSRSVIGAVNDYALCAEGMIRSERAHSALELTQVFSDWIVLRPEPMHPGERVRHAFGLRLRAPPRAAGE